jgi:dienelactone hydrolase
MSGTTIDVTTPDGEPAAITGYCMGGRLGWRR